MTDHTNDGPGSRDDGAGSTGPGESNVRYLPAHRLDRPTMADGAGTEIEPAAGRGIEHVGTVLEGETLTAQEYNARQKAHAIARWRGYGHDMVTVYKGAKTVVTHQRTKTVARHLLAYPVAGAGVVVRRWRDAHGAG